MRLVIFAPELLPYVKMSDRAQDIALIGGALAEAGHEVHAVIPWPADGDPSALSLARRLNTLEIEADGRPISCTRYDGRTPSGIHAHLLDMDRFPLDPAGDPGHEFWTAFCRAALALAPLVASDADWCVCFDSETALMPVIARSASMLAGSRFLLAITRLQKADERVHAGALAADRVTVHGRVLSDRVIALRVEPLATMLSEQRAVSVPAATATRRPPTLSEKSEAKAVLQTSFGLPLKPGIPLVAFPSTDLPNVAAGLAWLLTQDAQAVAFRRQDNESLVSLASRYPDRLALLPQGPIAPSMLLPADACVSIDDPRTTLLCLSHRTVPVVAPIAAEGVTDLEPSLSSGSAIVLEGDHDEALMEGLGRLQSAFRQGRSFRDLAARLPSFARSPHDVARMLVETMERE